MPESNSKIPDVCPFIKTCRHWVFKDHYEFICDTEGWVNCEMINPKDYAKYQKVPSEWKKGES